VRGRRACTERLLPPGHLLRGPRRLRPPRPGPTTATSSWASACPRRADRSSTTCDCADTRCPTSSSFEVRRSRHMAPHSAYRLRPHPKYENYFDSFQTRQPGSIHWAQPLAWLTKLWCIYSNADDDYTEAGKQKESKPARITSLTARRIGRIDLNETRAALAMSRSNRNHLDAQSACGQEQISSTWLRYKPLIQPYGESGRCILLGRAYF
jgi:hypothetical protein